MLLAAIVESSDDAFVSKTIVGVITSWNGGAERIWAIEPASEAPPEARVSPDEGGSR